MNLNSSQYYIPLKLTRGLNLGEEWMNEQMNELLATWSG